MSDQDKQDRGSSLKSEFPDTVIMEPDEGVDGEMDDDIQEEAVESRSGSLQHGQDFSHSSSKDLSGESPRKRKESAERRRRSHHHHRSGNIGSGHHRRRRSGGHSGEDVEAADEGGHSRKRVDGSGDQHPSDSSSRSSHRKGRDRRSSRSQRSRHHPDPGNDEWPHEDFGREKLLASSYLKRKDKEKKVEAEAEDGEILEDGELDDDGGNDDDNMHQDESRLSLDTSHEDIEGSPSKSFGKDEGKNQKRDKKKPEHRDKRRKEEDKKKRKKYVDIDKMSDEESGPAPVPAWGSGYQGVRQKSSPQRGPSHSPSYGKSSKSSRSKGYQSPPGLYDSPSYSEDSDDEQYPRCLDMLSGGYVDASVAADEKEGIFKRGITFKKKKRMDRNQLGKRRMQDFSKADGPPKKKALVDLAMSDRPKCKFYRDGKCAKGGGCPFNHDLEQAKRMEVCKYHLTVKGCHKERCLYMHDFPCKYFHTGAQCFSGDHCKFSHDPLTEDTRRALEMRVAPEDIIDVDDSDYDADYDYRPRNYESRSRPSLLGSPPRRHDVKKIPSLFDIEVHPPAPSPKPSPSSVRPSGFYNEAENSPPSSGSNTGNSQGAAPNNANSGSNNNSNNNGMNNNNNNVGNKSVGVGPNNQGGPGMLRPNMNNNMSGPGLLQTPSLPPVGGSGPIGSMIGGPNRPPLIGNHTLRPGMPFMNNNSNSAPPNNLPPVLNMLGAIIREAAMQKVSSASQNMNMSGPGINNMGGMNMVPNNGMNNMPPHGVVQNNMNNLGPNSMQPMNGNNMNMNNMPQGNMNAVGNMGPNNMNRMIQGMNPMGANNVNQMGPRMNAVGGNMNQMMPNNMNSNIHQGQSNDDSAMMSGDMPPYSNNRDTQQPEDMMDVDYRIKQNFDEDESSKDLSELDSIRRRLQEQINQEDADQEGEEEDEEGRENQGVEQSISQGDHGTEDKNGLSPEREEVSVDSSINQSSKPATDNSIDNIEVPAHLPKKQRELFMRIQQQHLLRERERERQEALKAAEESEKVDKDDWYSSSDEDDESKDKISESKEDPLKQSSEPLSTAETSSSNSKAPTTTASSTFNIMQMINAIRNQVSVPSSAESKTSGVAGQATGASNTSHSRRLSHTVETRSPASPPASPDDQVSNVPSFPPPPLGVEPPVVSAMPTKPLKYAIVRIALNMPKTYTFLPSDMDALHPSYRFDPRVKRHLQLVDKQPQTLPPPPPKEKEVRRSSAESAEKMGKLVDPRLKRAPTDPRLTKTGGSSPGSDGRPVDPRLKKDSAPSRPIDPRLAKRVANATNDPRLNRQISQESGSQIMGSQMNNMGGPLAGNSSMSNMNNMGGPMNNMGSPMGSMGSPMNNMGGPINTMGINNMGGAMNNMGSPMNNMGGPMNNMGNPMNNMGGPINNMGGPMNNMGGPMNNMGGLMNNQLSGTMNNMNSPVRSMAPMNRMGGPMGNPISSMGMPMNSMGVSMTSMGNNRMSSPMGNNSQGNNMLGPRGPPFVGGPMNIMGGPRGPSNMIPNQMAGSNERVQGDFPENPSDPRLTQRSLSDPRSNDPRLQNKSQEMQDQGINRSNPRVAGGSHASKASKLGDRGNDPRLSSEPRKSSECSNRKRLDDTSVARGYSGRRSPNLLDTSRERDNSTSKISKAVIEPLPSLSSSASLPPLPSLSPPSSSSSLMSSSSSISNTQSTPKESTSEGQKPSKKFDYRNDPRFKRVKRTSAGRQSSMEYSSPLGGEGEGQNTQDPPGSRQNNSYNRPEPVVSGSPHRPNAPSPSLPDTLQDFDMPEFPPLSVSEPDLKVKDLFKAIDPTASPFC